MTKAMGRPELRDDPRFATSADRVKNSAALNAIVEEWLSSMPSDDAAVAALEENRVACAPVLSVIDTMKHPYFKARDMVRKVRDPILGEVTIPGFPLKFSAYPDLPDIQAPLLGEHGAQVLKEVLDYSDARIAKLKEGGILFSENR
jgi:CoA:oxalate CoA-transferase